MKQLIILAVTLALAVPAMADTFGSGDNQFTIDFVTISGDASSANGTNISQWSPGHASYKAFSDPINSYRMGTYEITNAQWDKFINEHGKPDGSPSSAYERDAYWAGANIPTTCVSWYEAAQFVNWLNIEAGKTEAYKFTGTPGTSNYTLGVWGEADAWGGTNLYRHKDAYYFLPTEDEWVKAAYWNGTTLQTYATKAGQSLTQGNGTSGTGWNYDYATHPSGPWAVGSGSQELNNTHDMMGNVWEWMESPYHTGDYLSGSIHGLRGGSCYGSDYNLASSGRSSGNPYHEDNHLGFRVASIPEPATVLLLALGGLVLRRKQR